VMDMTHGAVREVFSCHPEEPQISFTGWAGYMCTRHLVRKGRAGGTGTSDMVGRTSVVLSTIQNCDRITVLDTGIVAEKGTPSSLMSKCPSSANYRLVSLAQ
jgi:hypothetical protein